LCKNQNALQKIQQNLKSKIQENFALKKLNANYFSIFIATFEVKSAIKK